MISASLYASVRSLLLIPLENPRSNAASRIVAMVKATRISTSVKPLSRASEGSFPPVDRDTPGKPVDEHVGTPIDFRQPHTPARRAAVGKEANGAAGIIEPFVGRREQ